MQQLGYGTGISGEAFFCVRVEQHHWSRCDQALRIFFWGEEIAYSSMGNYLFKPDTL
jgi:hypothetical protein